MGRMAKSAIEIDESGGTPAVLEMQTSTSPVQLLPITAVRESAANVRTYFDPEKLEQLKADIARNGQREPVTVKLSDEDGVYEIIDGARRFRCIQALMDEGHANAPLFIEARVKDVADEVEETFARLSSFNREELTPLDEARAYLRLKDLLEDERDAEDDNRHVSSVEVIAERLGVSVRHVEQRMALLDHLAAPVLEDLAAGIITVSHADELARLPEARQVSALMVCVRDELSVRGLKDWLRLQGWTKTAERDAHGEGVEEQEGGGSGADSDARGNAGASQVGADGGGPVGDDDDDRVGSSADGDEAEAEDVIEEAQADMDRQKNAAAVAEAKRKENDTTPDAEQHEGEGKTEEFRLLQAKRTVVAKHIVRAVLDGDRDRWVREIYDYVGSVYRNSSENSNIAVRSIYPQADGDIDSLNKAAAMLVAMKLSEFLMFPNFEQPDWNALCGRYDLDAEECALEAQAQILGVSVDELKKRKRWKPRKPRAARSDKGKAKPSPKVAKKVRAEKVSALQIKKNVAATKKSNGKGKKK